LNRLGVRKNTPCILIDADTYALKNLNNLVRTFLSRKIDIASLRCEAHDPQKIIELLQAYEYKIAMDNRRMDPWLTSGACNMAKASVFQSVFSRHSNFFAGGDIEIGKLAQVMGYKIAHLNFTFYTEVPSTIRDWYNQRVIWFAGGVRHHVANIGSFGWHHFFIFFYNSLIVYLLLPLRWLEVSNFPLTLVVLVVLSWAYTVVLTLGQGWRAGYLFLPVYAFFQSMIILPVAFVRYCKYAWQHRSLGLLSYDLSRHSLAMRMLFKGLNISTAAMVLFAAFAFTDVRFEYWYANGTILKDVAAYFSAWV
jgi:cellulose synthase/poly-beta-1,6-N-acetylglucosamine synthase-like glycosyltransferase